MKTLLIFVCLFVGFSASSNAADFRRVFWNSSPEDVSRTEQGSFEESYQLEDGVSRAVYSDFVNGIPAAIVYDFKDDQLVLGAILFAASYNACTSCFETDYQEVQYQLQKDYGLPDSSEKFTNSWMMYPTQMQHLLNFNEEFSHQIIFYPISEFSLPSSN